MPSATLSRMSLEDATDPQLQSLRRAAEDTSPVAWFQLAQGLVARQRMEEAHEWHRRAATQGFAPAQIELARMQLYGVGVDANPAEAIEWLLRAEQAQAPVASYLLAMVALGGAAGFKDDRINERLFAAVQADFAPALRAAAIHFGRKNNPVDQTTCLQLLERGATRGDAACAALLAERLKHGEGCKAQAEEAEDLWQQLEQQGFARLPACQVPLAAEAVPARRLALEDDLMLPQPRALCERPRVSIIDGLLSADECRLLIFTARPMLRRSGTVDPATGVPVKNELRTSMDASFDPLVEDLALRLAQLRMTRAAQTPFVNAEQLIVLRYLPGEQYHPHRDYLPASTIAQDHPEAGNRARTICLYLNEPEAGGETAFPVPGVKAAPRAGRAVIFDNLLEDGRPDVDSLHAGLPVQSGEKWLATLWLRQGQYRAY